MASGYLKDYLGYGLIASRPATPDLEAGTAGYWFATDTKILSTWNGSSWEDITDGGGGIPDAPSDGKLYGRKDAAWEEIVGGGGGSNYAWSNDFLASITVGSSSSAFASKGNIVDLTVDGIIRGASVRVTTAGTYRAFVGTLDLSDVITSIDDVSTSQVITTTNTYYSFQFPTIPAYPAGTRVILGLSRIDGTDTSICGVNFTSRNELDQYGYTITSPGFSLAKATPLVGDTVTISSGTNTVTMSMVHGVKL